MGISVHGCNKQETTPPPPARNAAPQPAVPPTTGQAGTHQQANPATAGALKSSDGKGSVFAHEGIELVIPSEWVAEAPNPGPMAPIAVFRLPKAEGDTANGSIRITYFPSMKGKDEMNIGRWLSQVQRADGQPAAKEDAKITIKELGSVRVTMFDITGTISGSMDGSGAGGTPNQRMINAIIDHPRGPHYLRCSGAVGTLTKWQAAIEACALGAKVKE